MNIEELFSRFGVANFWELYLKFLEEDKKLFVSGPWDDEDQSLLVNQIKTTLEAIDPSHAKKNGIDLEGYTDTLWLWYHHAISTAIWRKKDRALAQRYADRAVELQGSDPYNKLTKLLQLLAYDRLVDAKLYIKSITEEPERTSAHELIEEYERGEFF